MSWHTPRAIVYREMNNIADSLGTAVNVQAMVFGNFGDDSGSGVAFTRNPSTGETVFSVSTCSTPPAKTWSPASAPLAGVRPAGAMPDIYDELYDTQALLEKHYRDMQDIEFTVQEGKFYMLQTRSGKRTGRASVKIAVDMVREELITESEALMRVSPDHVEAFLHPMVDPAAKQTSSPRAAGQSRGRHRPGGLFCGGGRGARLPETA